MAMFQNRWAKPRTLPRSPGAVTLDTRVGSKVDRDQAAATPMVPLANMFGYVNQLRSFTQGRAQYSMQFSHYDEVPANVADEVKAKLA